MKIVADYVVVGSGLTGATIARTLVDAGKDVVVLEARDRIGGNVADAHHSSGFRYNLYGPHYFRTSSSRIQEFVVRFSAFYPFAATVMSQVGHELVHWPLHRNDFQRFAGGAFVLPPQQTLRAANFEQEMLALMPAAVYQTFVGDYTQKQWGVEPKLLAADLAKRIEVRDDGDIRLSKATFQALPVGGFSSWIGKILDGIPIHLNTDFHAMRDNVVCRKLLIYTGSIDRYFQFSLGRLPYRTQRRSTIFIAGTKSVYPCGQVNLPRAADGAYVRTIEWRHMLAPGEGPNNGTLLTFETPDDATDWTNSEYPFPSQSARQLYSAYADLAAATPDMLFCGRLGEYRYLDMDQAIARAMMLADRVLVAKP